MSKTTDIEANATSLDGLVCDNGLIPTLRNGPKPSYQYLVDGWNNGVSALIQNTEDQIEQITVDATAAADASEASAQRAEVAADKLFKGTTQELISGNALEFDVGDTIETNGFYATGDGGGALWVKTSDTDTPNQTPAQLGSAKLTDSLGYVWDLVIKSSLMVKSVGANDDVSNNTLVFSAIENTIATRVDLQGGDYYTELLSQPNDQPLKKSYFNGNVYLTSGITGAYELFKPSVNINDFELYRNRSKSPVLSWEGLNVLWLGTSIPHQGEGIDSYPEIFGDKLRCNVNNMAFSGSHASFDKSDDPFNIGTVKALSMTEDDRQIGLSTYGTSSAYDDSFDAVTKASQMTADYRIAEQFSSSPFDVVILDHNHNDRAREAGTLRPQEIDINSITKGAQTVISISDASGISAGDSLCARVEGVNNLDYLAVTIIDVTGNDLSVNIDSTEYVGEFLSGTLQIVDKATIFGAWQFILFYINNLSLVNGIETKVILCGAPSEHTNDTMFENSIFRVSQVLKEFADFYGLTMFDIGYEYNVNYEQQLTYFPDGVHPTTLETRQSIANYWVEWANGGRTPTVESDKFLPSAQDGLEYVSSSTPTYNSLREGFTTQPVTYIDDSYVIDDDFSSGLSDWTTTGNAPTVVSAPWGEGSAVLCSSTVADNRSRITNLKSISNSWDLDFDFWLPEVSGLNSDSLPKTVVIAQVRPNGQAYSLQLIIRENYTNLRLSYFKEPNVGAVNVGTSKVRLTKETRNNIKIRMEKATENYNGYISVELNGEQIIKGELLDSEQDTPNKLQLGVISSNLSIDYDMYIGNVKLMNKLELDTSSSFTGDVTVGEGVISFVNGIAMKLT